VAAAHGRVHHLQPQQILYARPLPLCILPAGGAQPVHVLPELGCPALKVGLQPLANQEADDLIRGVVAARPLPGQAAHGEVDLPQGNEALGLVLQIRGEGGIQDQQAVLAAAAAVLVDHEIRFCLADGVLQQGLIYGAKLAHPQVEVVDATRW